MMQTAKSLFVTKPREGYDFSVSLARIAGMIFIVACHIGNHFNNAIVSQVFNVGVPLFFVISGGLCADKEIKQPRQWLAQRFARLYMPLLAWALYYLISALIQQNGHLEKDTVFALVLMLFNLQGLRHFFTGFISVDGPWFFTIIMICYALVIPYKRLEKKFNTRNGEFFTGGGGYLY